MDTRWRRRALGWRTPRRSGRTRTPLTENRETLRLDVQRIAERSYDARTNAADFPRTWPERLAIEVAASREAELISHGGASRR